MPNIFHFRQFDILQDHAAQKVGTDSDLLGALAPGGQRILDIGAGTGVLSLMMAQRFPDAQVTGIEIDDDAVLDATENFARSPFAPRLTLIHQSLQDYMHKVNNRVRPHYSPQPNTQYPIPAEGLYDAIICNPPYFHRSLECPTEGRTRARHTSSLPFPVLIGAAARLLVEGGYFTVCLPTEVLEEFHSLCLVEGFSLHTAHRIKTLPHKPAKRHILTYQKGYVPTTNELTHCMLDAPDVRSAWYLELMKPFLII